MSRPQEAQRRKSSDAVISTGKRQLPALPHLADLSRRGSAPAIHTPVERPAPDKDTLAVGKQRRPSLVSSAFAENEPITESPEGAEGNVKISSTRRHSQDENVVHPLMVLRRGSVPLPAEPFNKLLGFSPPESVPKVSSYRRVSGRRRSSVRQSDIQQRTTLQLAFTLQNCTFRLARSVSAQDAEGELSVCLSRHGRLATSCSVCAKPSDADARILVADFDNVTVSLPVTLAALPTHSGEVPKYLRKDIDIRVKFRQSDTEGPSRTVAKTSVDVSQWLPCDEASFCRPHAAYELNVLSRWRNAPFASASFSAVAMGRVLRKFVTEVGRPAPAGEDLSDISFDEDLDEDDSDDDVLASPTASVIPSTPVGIDAAAANNFSTVSATAPSVAAPSQKQTSGRRPSQVSSTDAPSETGNGPTASTTAFAFDGHHNKLGMVHIELLSATGLHVPPKVKSRHVSLPVKSALVEGCGAYWTATVNGGMTKQTTSISRYTLGLPLRWMDANSLRFYALSSHQLILTCRCCKMTNDHLLCNTVPHKENAKDACLAVATIPLGNLPALADKGDLLYSPSTPEQGRMDPGVNGSSTTMKLTPNGQVMLRTTFTELPCRSPVIGEVAVNILQAIHLPVSRGQLVMCTVKCDGRSQGCTSEVKVSSSSAPIHWPEDSVMFTAQSGCDLELHMWSRRPGEESDSLAWLAYGVMPLAYCASETVKDWEPIEVFHVRDKHTADAWVPLEPQGFVQVRVQLSSHGSRASSRRNSSGLPSPSSAQTSDRQADKLHPKSLTRRSSKDDEVGETRNRRKKSDPKWSDLKAVLRDRVELRREVDFLHDQLRNIKAQLAACEYKKQQLEIENRSLHGKLTGRMVKMQKLATKATQLELKSIIQQSSTYDDEGGYGSAF